MADGTAARSTAPYAVVLGAYGVLAGTLAVLVRRRAPGRLPKLSPADVVMLGLATFKLSRLVSKEKVLAPVREPFVAETSPGDGTELNSKPARGGLRHVVGELVTCPFCISVWIATVLTAVFTMAPRAVRLAASCLGAVVIADSSQYVYARLRQDAP